MRVFSMGFRGRLRKARAQSTLPPAALPTGTTLPSRHQEPSRPCSVWIPQLALCKLAEVPGAALLQQHGIHRLLHLLAKQHELACVKHSAAARRLLAQVTCCKAAQASSHCAAVVALLSCNNSVKESFKNTINSRRTAQQRVSQVSLSPS